ncbi:hypothetical protein ABBQ32_010359 [Trebouxia sp. C0010 RCD-2024]
MLLRTVRVHRHDLFRTADRQRFQHSFPRRPASSMSTRSVKNDNNAFIDPELHVQHSGGGPLTGLRFAAKDLFDVSGHITGYGQPTWRSTHDPAKHTSQAVQALLDAGADLAGKTHLDELAYSLNGENIHYGTPVNPACPDRIPGGSSSGSAVATADGSVDIGLGSDTGGSVRVPASYCGLLGVRPTHGRVTLQHACTLARSYDTCGWFARNAEVLRQVGDVLLDPASRQEQPLQRWLTAADAFKQCDKATGQAIYESLQGHLAEVKGLLGEPQEVTVASLEGVGSLSDWWQVFRITQAAEIWEELGDWITTSKPDLGPGTKERFHMASQLQPDEIQAARKKRQKISVHLENLLGSDGVLMLPTAPGPAPFLRTPPAELDLFRSRLLSLTCIAGLGGLPQVSLPIAKVNGCPVGLSLISPKGSDERLLQVTEKLMQILKH